MIRPHAYLSVVTLLATGCVGALDDPGLGESAVRNLSAGSEAEVYDTGSAKLALRSTMGREFQVLGELDDGAVVDVVAGPIEAPHLVVGAPPEVVSGAAAGVEGGNEFYLYQVTSGTSTGYVRGKFLKPSGLPTGPFTPPPGEETLLPWAAGTTHQVTGAPGTGMHTGKGQYAYDFAMEVGTEVLAAHSGVVRMIKNDSYSGGCSGQYIESSNYVVLDRGDGIESLYLHLGRIDVTPNQAVERGEVLGLSGMTGYTCGPHLHFQFQKSPSGGGDSFTYWNQTVAEPFHDSGDELLPRMSDYAMSANLL